MRFAGLVFLRLQVQMMKCQTILTVLCSCGFSAVAALGAPEQPKVTDQLAGPWQLFVDDYVIASRRNLVRRYHSFEKDRRNPLIVVDRPWEADVVACTSVLAGEDGRGLRMYYYCWTPKGDPARSYMCYATSEDGLTWTKPSLGLHEWKGSKDNNIVPNAGGSVIPAPWEANPDRRYYSFGGGGQYFARVSPDGLRWTSLSDQPAVTGGDTGWFYWDPHTRRFRCTVKLVTEVSGLRRRCVGFSETTEATRFPPLRMIMAPDDFDDRWCHKGSVERTHFYACPVQAYETMYIGLLQIYRAEDPEGYFHGPLWLELVTSRDGVHFLREEGDRPPLLHIGKFRSFDHGMVFAPPLVAVGDELWMFYTGYDELHDLLPYHSAIGLARLRKDGFASLDADGVPGEVLTKPFADAAGTLQINADARGGSVRVEVLDAEGRVIPGYGRDECEPLSGNSVRQTATWKGASELPAGRGPLRFRFLLERARLYSFMAGPKARVIEERATPPLQALFTFECDSDPWSDMLGADGRQEMRSLGTCRMDDRKPPAGAAAKPAPAFGKRSLVIGSEFRPLNRVEITGTQDLGRHFTLAAMVRSANHAHARLFSSYSGNFPTNTSELIFDFDPRGRAASHPVVTSGPEGRRHACGVLSGLRLVCKGMAVESEPVSFDDDRYHHLAVTYDDGEISFYLDGRPAGRQWVPGGEPVRLARNLLVGEDAELGTNEQLMGNVDDVLVLGWCLKPDEIARLSRDGAAAFFAQQ